MLIMSCKLIAAVNESTSNDGRRRAVCLHLMIRFRTTVRSSRRRCFPLTSCITSNAFLEIHDNLLERIIYNHYLEVRELDLFNAYFKWTGHQLQKQNKPINDTERREVTEYFNIIRFPIMSTEEFASDPAGTNILTSDEKIDILLT